MIGWVEHIEWAEEDRARKLMQARDVLAADEWSGASAAFEEYLIAADELEVRRFLGFSWETTEHAAARAAAAAARACLGVQVDAGSWLALEEYFDACQHWRDSHKQAFEAIEAGTFS